MFPQKQFWVQSSTLYISRKKQYEIRFFLQPNISYDVISDWSIVKGYSTTDSFVILAPTKLINSSTFLPAPHISISHLLSTH